MKNKKQTDDKPKRIIELVRIREDGGSNLHELAEGETFELYGDEAAVRIMVRDEDER